MRTLDVEENGSNGQEMSYVTKKLLWGQDSRAMENSCNGWRV